MYFRNFFTCLVFSLLLIVFQGCISAPFEDFYSDYISNSDLSADALLKTGEVPTVYAVSNLWDETYEMMSSKYYRLKGYSGFSTNMLYNANELRDGAKETAEKFKAKVALYSWHYTGETETWTEYESKSSYNSTTRTTTTSLTPKTYTSHQKLYELYCLSPYTKEEIAKWHLGLYVRDLNTDERKDFKRNTGVIVRTVFQKYPAFYAEITRDDLIIEINGIQVRDIDDFNKIEAGLKTDDSVKMKIIHDGEEKNIALTAK